MQVPAQSQPATAAGALDAALAAQIAAEAEDVLTSDETGATAAEAVIAAQTAPGGAQAQPALLASLTGAATPTAGGATPAASDETGATAAEAVIAAQTAPGRAQAQPALLASLTGSPTPTAEGATPAASDGGAPVSAPVNGPQTGTRTSAADGAEGVASTEQTAAAARIEPQRAEMAVRPDPGLPQAAGRPADLPAVVTPEPRGEVPVMPRALPPGAIPVEIGLRALQGLKEFQIRLDPAELGRVDVKLEIGDDKSVTARVVVDRVETLQLLQRDARTLERAFEQAGLKSSEGGIDITLRDPGQQGREDRRDGTSERADTDNSRGRAATVIEAPAPLLRRIHAGGLDLSI
jgi:flagellar hook-length control protein FliK